jgi:hypothetical protein
MMHHGQSGYLASCKKIMATATHIKSSLSTSPILSKHLKVLGDPLSTVVAFTSREEADKKGAGGKGINMYAVGDRMSKRGWHLNALEDPAALHIACTMVRFSLLSHPSPLITVSSLHINEGYDELTGPPSLSRSSSQTARRSSKTSRPSSRKSSTQRLESRLTEARTRTRGRWYA